MAEHFIAMKWDPTTTPYSFLFLRDIEKDSKTIIKKPLLPQEFFNVTISDDKICVGHKINSEKYHFCLNNVEKKFNQCYGCSQKDFQRCFLLCDPTKPFGTCTENQEAYEYCKAHACSVYLALIADKTKVGVSFNPLKRWINQGADVATEVFRAINGIEARKIERDLATNLGISQSVKVNQKSKKLNYDSKKSIDTFRELTRKVSLYLQKTDYKSSPSNILHVETELAPYYGKIPFLTVNPIINDVSKTKSIAGEIVGTKGAILVTKVGNSYYSTHLTQIYGHSLTSTNTALRAKRQKSLSDFF